MLEGQDIILEWCKEDVNGERQLNHEERACTCRLIPKINEETRPCCVQLQQQNNGICAQISVAQGIF